MHNLKNKKVLVTGAFGFLGGHIVEALLSKSAIVVGLTHDFHKDSYVSLEDLPIDHVVSGDITSLLDMRRVVADYEIEYIFHLAAKPIVRTCVLDPIGCFDANIMGTANVLEAARQTGRVKGVLCMESDKSYGSFDPKDLPYKEDQALKPTNTYEVSKACAGFVAKAYDYNYEVPTFTIRGANLYGPGDMNLSRLIPGSILKLLNGEQPILYRGVHNYIREFIYVEDAANIIVDLMQQIDTTRGHAINLGSGQKYSIKAMLDHLCRMVNPGTIPKIVDKGDLFKEIEEQHLDLTKLRTFVPDYPFTSTEEGLKETVDWYTQFQNKTVKEKQCN